MKKNIVKGFTLIELLVVMGVLAIMGGVILSIFFSVLRGTNKPINLLLSGKMEITLFPKCPKSSEMLNGLSIQQAALRLYLHHILR